MNPIKSLFDPIEKLINEHGSATILRDHLALFKDQLAILKDKFTVLEAENLDLKTENQYLKTENSKSAEEIQRLNYFIQNQHTNDWNPIL